MKTYVKIKNGFEIFLYTKKFDGCLKTCAILQKTRYENGKTITTLRFPLKQTVVVSWPCKRATKQAIERSHNEALKRVDDLILEYEPYAR